MSHLQTGSTLFRSYISTSDIHIPIGITNAIYKPSEYNFNCSGPFSYKCSVIGPSVDLNYIDEETPQNIIFNILYHSDYTSINYANHIYTKNMDHFNRLFPDVKAKNHKGIDIGIFEENKEHEQGLGIILLNYGEALKLLDRHHENNSVNKVIRLWLSHYLLKELQNGSVEEKMIVIETLNKLENTNLDEIQLIKHNNISNNFDLINHNVDMPTLTSLLFLLSALSSIINIFSFESSENLRFPMYVSLVIIYGILLLVSVIMSFLSKCKIGIEHYWVCNWDEFEVINYLRSHHHKLLNHMIILGTNLIRLICLGILIYSIFNEKTWVAISIFIDFSLGLSLLDKLFNYYNMMKG